jgi:hypothetical protein
VNVLTINPLYFANWWFDSLMIGGLSIVTWLGLSAFYSNGDLQPLAMVALGLSLFVNFPHFSATVYRLYQSSEHTRQFPVTAWGLPPVIIGAVAACFWQPQVVTPYFLLLYLLWSPYHYSGQTVGITMVYARRAGFPIGRRERLALSTFVFAAFLCGFIAIKQAGFADFYGMSVQSVAVPAWMYPAAQAVMCTGALVFAGFAIVWCVRERRMLPPIVLLPALAHFVWFVPGVGLKAFVLVVPFFHSLQYLLIALAMQLKLRLDSPGAEHSWRRIRTEAFRWGSRNIAGGVLLFIGIPVLLSWLPLPFVTIAGIVAAAVNIHHFFVDGVIWKLRDASSSSALLMNVAELSQVPPLELGRPIPARA